MSTTKKVSITPLLQPSSSSNDMTIFKQNVVTKTSKPKEIKSSTREASKEEDATKKVPSKTIQSLSKPVIPSKTSTVRKNVAKRNAPTTPPSNRVTKSQFYPSKNMYATALKNVDTKNRNPTTTPKIKQVEQKSKPTTSKIKIKKSAETIQLPLESPIERPRTATLRKPSIVSENIVGPDIAPIPIDDYEDDFDSYASDFEEYQSSSTSSSIFSLPSTSTSSSSTSESETTPAKTRLGDEEKKLDSGNFELHENKHVPILENITETTTKHSSLSDEGFEDAKSLQFINFMGAKKKQQREKSQRKKRKRGEELLSMIRLNDQYFELFELAPIAYEDFIKIYGKSNTYQVNTQTGDDNLQEETQTDYIEVKNRWTQFPPVFDNVQGKEGCRNIKIETGSDDLVGESKELFNEFNLLQFMANTGRLVDQILYETSKYRNNLFDNQNERNQISDAFSTLEVDILKGRKVTFVNFFGDKLVSFHEPPSGDGDGEFCGKSIGCIWNLKDFQKAEIFVSTFGLVTCACIDVNDRQILFAGSEDGSVSLWKITSSREQLDNFYIELCKIDGTTVIPASFMTNVDFKSSYGIVSIFSYFDDNLKSTTHKTSAVSKVLSLHEDGVINNWSVIKKENSLSLVKIRTISLQERHPDLNNLLCKKMTLNPKNINHLYVATNYGFTLHCPETNGRSSTRHFPNSETSDVLSIEASPHFSEFFLSTHSNGNICLFKRYKAKPLMTIMNNNEDIRLNQLIHWSPFRPCIFYTADDHNVLHVWDLAYSEFHPSISVPFKRGIKFLEIQPPENENQEKGYMVLVNNDYEIEIHILNKEHGPSQPDDFKIETKQFCNYVKRL